MCKPRPRCAEARSEASSKTMSQRARVRAAEIRRVGIAHPTGDRPLARWDRTTDTLGQRSEKLIGALGRDQPRAVISLDPDEAIEA